MKQIIVRTIATEFSRQLRQNLKEIEIEMINRLNGEEPIGSNICHTHDYCDPNELMAKAFKEVLGREIILYDDQIPGTLEQWNKDSEVWAAAWAYAKYSQFEPYDGLEVYKLLNDVIQPIINFDDYNKPVQVAIQFIRANEQNYKFSPRVCYGK